MSSPEKYVAELLSPAGDADCLRAAIANGANAIYFGLDHGFNARARAGNFSVSSLPTTMSQLHGEGVRGYVTLNTLAFSNELDELARTIELIADAGVDAVLVQDLGVARLVKEICPELELHASTQMTLTSAETIEAARRLGLSRVVLARELSLDEIRKIRAATDMPLEVFVHGALCVAYSGQCLTSESLGGRSANRGQCAQACRLPYELNVDGEDRDLGPIRYLLSPQDLAAYALIPELIDAGVCSFKIEGRLKTPEYVANITRHYRQAIDAALSGTPKRFTAEEVREMEMSFSRGFSPGWLQGNDHKQLVPGETSAKRGVLAGKIVQIRGRNVIVKNSIPLQAGDGVVFEGSRERGEEIGGRIYRIERRGRSVDGEVAAGECELVFAQESVALDRLNVGQRFWKTDDPRMSRKWRQSYQEGKRVRRIPLEVSIQAIVGQPLVMEVFFEGRSIGRHVDEYQPVKAERHVLNESELEKQLGRLGGTPFVLTKVESTIVGTPMVPLSVLGSLRRILGEIAMRDLERPIERTIHRNRLQTLIDSATQTALHSPMVSKPTVSAQSAIDADSALEPTPSVEINIDSPAALVVLCRTLEQLQAAVGLNCVDFECDFQDIREYREAVKVVGDSGKRLWLAPPRITKPGEAFYAAKVAKYGAHGILARNLAHIELCREQGLPFVADFSLNATNELTVATLLERGATRVTPSYDMDREQLKRLVDQVDASRLEVVVHQHMPMFHMEHCVFCALISPGTNKTNCGRPCDRHQVKLRDRIGMEHPLKADVACRNTLYNATPQSGAEVVHDLMRRGVRHLRIELLESNANETVRIFQTYAQLLAGELTGTEVWQRLQAANRVGVTRGTLEARRDPLAIL